MDMRKRTIRSDSRRLASSISTQRPRLLEYTTISTQKARNMLSDRRQMVLRALIEEYVACALPVGSRTIVDHYKLSVSPATVRNDLSALESEGYLKQPHTSAGRIPTDAGYRAFVDEILETQKLNADDGLAATIDQMRKSADKLDDMVCAITEELTRLTDCLSIVFSPLEHQIRKYGIASLLRKPEFHNSESLLPLMEILEDDSILFSAFDGNNARGDNIVVKIGSENAERGFSGVSVVTGTYGTDASQGIVAVIGPTRMDYTKVIRAVRAAQNAMERDV